MLSRYYKDWLYLSERGNCSVRNDAPNFRNVKVGIGINHKVVELLSVLKRLARMLSSCLLTRKEQNNKNIHSKRMERISDYVLQIKYLEMYLKSMTDNKEICDICTGRVLSNESSEIVPISKKIEKILVTNCVSGLDNYLSLKRIIFHRMFERIAL